MNSSYVFPKKFETFFRQTHEINFCFYKRKHLRHYAEYTNSCHEGTKKGIKYNSAPILPRHYLAKSCIIMSKNGERPVTKKKHENAKSFCPTRPHSTVACGNYLVENCECRLQGFMDIISNFDCIMNNKKRKESTGSQT